MTFPGGSTEALRRSLRTVAQRDPRAVTLPRTHRRVALASVPDAVVSLFVDGFVFIVACPFVLGFGAVLFRELWPAAAIVAAFAYLAGTWAGGQSLGMRAAGIRLVRQDTAEAPGLALASLRAALLLPLITAVFLLADAALPQESRAFAAEPVIIYTCLALVAFGFVTHA